MLARRAFDAKVLNINEEEPRGDGHFAHLFQTSSSRPSRFTACCSFVSRDIPKTDPTVPRVRLEFQVAYGANAAVTENTPSTWESNPQKPGASNTRGRTLGAWEDAATGAPMVFWDPLHDLSIGENTQKR